MKKLISLLLALTMVFALVACGGAAKEEPKAEAEAPAAEAPKAEAPAEEAKPEFEGTIKIGYFSDLSSADGYIGMAGLYALQDRAEELNANGGLLGKKVEVIGYDNAVKN